MKALLKIILGLLLVVALVLVGAVVYLDQLAKTGIEKGATYALGVQTTVDAVKLGVQTGDFGFDGLAVENPTGFGEPFFLKIASARMELPLDRLMNETIHIPQVAIEGIDVTLLKLKGSSNYDKILENLGRLESGESSEAAAPSTRQLIIDELILRDIDARIAIGLLGEATTFDVNVPEIRLHNLGGKDGVSTSELTAIVTKAVLGTVMRSGGLPGDIVKDLGSRLGALAKLDIKLPQGLGDVASKLLGGKDAGESDVAGNIGNVIGGLLGVGKNKDDAQ